MLVRQLGLSASLLVLWRLPSHSCSATRRQRRTIIVGRKGRPDDGGGAAKREPAICASF
jgi:hypothetical protein